MNREVFNVAHITHINFVSSTHFRFKNLSASLCFGGHQDAGEQKGESFSADQQEGGQCLEDFGNSERISFKGLY